MSLDWLRDLQGTRHVDYPAAESKLKQQDDRIAALEDVVRELVDDDDCLIPKVLRDKAFELLNQNGGK